MWCSASAYWNWRWGRRRTVYTAAWKRLSSDQPRSSPVKSCTNYSLPSDWMIIVAKLGSQNSCEKTNKFLNPFRLRIYHSKKVTLAVGCNSHLSGSFTELTSRDLSRAGGPVMSHNFRLGSLGTREDMHQWWALIRKKFESGASRVFDWPDYLKPSSERRSSKTSQPSTEKPSPMRYSHVVLSSMFRVNCRWSFG